MTGQLLGLLYLSFGSGYPRLGETLLLLRFAELSSCQGGRLVGKAAIFTCRPNLSYGR